MNDPSMRLAPFLRESCAQNLYGLSYLDQEQTILRIPWPVVPKQSRGVPPGFEIFHVSLLLWYGMVVKVIWFLCI